jgi:hypothetical protein
VVDEFEKIGHFAGKITFRVLTDQQGQRRYQLTISGNRPVPAERIVVHALPQGLPIAAIQLGGIGQAWHSEHSVRRPNTLFSMKTWSSGSLPLRLESRGDGSAGCGKHGVHFRFGKRQETLHNNWIKLRTA